MSTASQLVTAVVGASTGDTIVMAPGNYAIKSALDVSVNVTVEGPTAAPGATINGGSMINPSTIDPGQFDIFAVASGATLTLHDVSLTGTLQPSNGAVMIQSGGDASIGYALVSSNQSPGVDAEGDATITNSTITQSNGGNDGIIDDGAVTLNEDTIAYNSARGLNNHGGGSATVYNTIFAGNTLGNCYFAITVANGTGSNSDDSGTSCGSLITTGGAQNTGNGVITGTSPALNGGPTNTYALPNGSVAIDHGTGTGAAADDQRHYPRDATPDIGAYEFGAVPAGAKLTVKKFVVGGTAQPSDFMMTVTDTTTSTVLSPSPFPGSNAGTTVSIPAGDNYTVTESGAQTANYVESNSAACSGTAVVNSTPTCTVTNSDVATLTVKKVVVGPGSPSDFTLKVTDTTTSTVLDSSPGSSSGHQVSVPVGDNYAVTESGATAANYTPVASAGCSGTATQGGTPSCTITNTAKPSTLTVKKIVVGGTAQPSDFMMTVKDTTTNTVLAPSPFPGSNAGTAVSVPAGDNYTVTESGAQTPNYNESNSAGCAGTAAANGALSCTVTNTLKPTILTVKKVVVGPGQPSDFTLTVTDTTTSAVLNSSPGSSAGKQVSVPAGDNYTVTESGAMTANYTESNSAGCSGTATINGTASCTITNTAKPTTLTVTKIVVGGTAAPSDFTLTVTDTTTNAVLDASPGSSSGKQVAVPAGDGYKVTESGPQTSSYSESDSAGCTGTATANGSASCTITNTVKLAKLTVILHVVGSKLAPSKFSIHVKGGTPRPSSFKGSKSGTKVSLNGGSYSVSVGSKKGYKGKLAAGCHGTVQPGGSAICKIIETKQKKHHH